MMTVLTLVAVGIGFVFGYAVHTRYPHRAKCAHAFCSSRADPRCVAGNCTFHCQSTLGCNERCLDAWADAVKRGEVALPGSDGRADVDLSFLKPPPK